MNKDCPYCNNTKIGNIRNFQFYANSLWPWNIFNDCFSNGIRLTDLDGIVERKGYFLVFEGKGFVDNNPSIIPHGQQIMFNYLLRTGKFIIIILWAHIPGEPEKYQMQWFDNGIIKKSVINDCDLSTIKNYVKIWYSNINKG